MDREVIEQKLESLRRSIRRIEGACPSSAEQLAQDLDAQDIVTLNLTRAVQLAVDIGAHILSSAEQSSPVTMGETFVRLHELAMIDEALATHLKKAVGFRNIAIHHYEAINWVIVHAIVHDRLGDFAAFARAVCRWLDQPGP